MVIFCEKCGKAVLPTQIKKETRRVRCVCGNLIQVSAKQYDIGKSELLIPSERSYINHIPEKCPTCSSNLILIEEDKFFYIQCSKQGNCDFSAMISNPEEQKCPKCDNKLAFYKLQKKMVLGCSRYPICKFFIESDLAGADIPAKKSQPSEESKEIQNKLPAECPDCGSTFQLRQGPYGVFLGCRSYPSCKFTFNIQDPANIHCPLCGSLMIEKSGKYGRFLGCYSYPDCKYIINISKKY